MTKRLIILGLALILILFLPIPIGALDDGGTRIYASLTYKIVKWNRLMSVYVDGNIEKIDTYSKTSVYFFPENFKSVDELWDIEHPETYSYSGTFQVRSVKFSNIEVADYSSAMMLDLLNNGEWINDVTDCAHDYVLNFDDSSLRYHSSCGTFIDIENKRSLRLNESDKEAVNAIMEALFDGFDPSWE